MQLSQQSSCLKSSRVLGSLLTTTLKTGHGSWRNGSAVKSTCCFCRRQRLSSQYPHSGLQPFITLVPGDPTHSSDLLEHQACSCRQNIHTYKMVFQTNKLSMWQMPVISTLESQRQGSWKRDGLVSKAMHKHEDLSSEPHQGCKMLGLVTCACNPISKEAETEGSLELDGQIFRQIGVLQYPV